MHWGDAVGGAVGFRVRAGLIQVACCLLARGTVDVVSAAARCSGGQCILN